MHVHRISLGIWHMKSIGWHNVSNDSPSPFIQISRGQPNVKVFFMYKTIIYQGKLL